MNIKIIFISFKMIFQIKILKIIFKNVFFGKFNISFQCYKRKDIYIMANVCLKFPLSDDPVMTEKKVHKEFVLNGNDLH